MSHDMEMLKVLFEAEMVMEMCQTKTYMDIQL